MPVEQGRDTYDVTVAMLTRNAIDTIERCLEAVAAQRTAMRVEVLVVDSGSTDGTVEALARYPVRVKAIPEAEFDFGATRDLAYQEARGGIIVNLSQDAIPKTSDWLESLLRPLDDERVGASCGSSSPDPARGSRQFPWERNGYFYFTREIRKFVRRYGRGLSFANSAVPRAVWERLRLDPQPTGEDFQFQIKLRNAGLQVAFPSDAEVLHHHDYALRALFNRCRNEGLALRMMGCRYTEADLVCDLASLPKYVQGLRELRRGSLKTWADFAFPVLRPVAVYLGSRFARRAVWS
jgi:glycosyltransferase involved in cell wall biosynthesis